MSLKELMVLLTTLLCHTRNISDIRDINYAATINEYHQWTLSHVNIPGS